MTTATRTKPKPADAPAVSPPPERFVLTASQADMARQKREAVQEFELTATSQYLDGVAIAKVRMVDLNDAASLIALPEPLLRKVLAIANDVGLREGDTSPIKDDGSLDIERSIQIAKSESRGIDAYCIAGFVDPPLAFTEEEQTTTAHVLVSDIHPADRRRFYEWCLGRHREAAATVETFPGSQQLGDGVDARRSGGINRAATKRTAVPAPDASDHGSSAA